MSKKYSSKKSDDEKLPSIGRNRDVPFSPLRSNQLPKSLLSPPKFILQNSTIISPSTHSRSVNRSPSPPRISRSSSRSVNRSPSPPRISRSVNRSPSPPRISRSVNRSPSPETKKFEYNPFLNSNSSSSSSPRSSSSSPRSSSSSPTNPFRRPVKPKKISKFLSPVRSPRSPTRSPEENRVLSPYMSPFLKPLPEPIFGKKRVENLIENKAILTNSDIKVQNKIRGTNLPSLEPTDNLYGPILSLIPEDELPDIGIEYPPGYVMYKIDEREAYIKSDISKIIKKASEANNFGGYEVTNIENGKLVPFDNPNRIRINRNVSKNIGNDYSYKGDIELLPNQIDVARRLVYGYQYTAGFMNTGRLGSGKTFLALWLAQYFNYSIIVVAPTTLHNTWIEASVQADIPIYEIITYESLRSIKYNDPKHGLLKREENVRESRGKSVEYTSFTPTKKLERLIDSGVFFIFDETQKTKNKSAQFLATNAIIRTIHQRGGLSRYLMLSGSPIDKIEHIMNLYSLLNITDDDEATQSPKESYATILRKARMVDSRQVDIALNDYDLVSGNKEVDKAFRIFYHIYKPRFITGMNLTLDIESDIRNGFYFISPQYIDKWFKSINGINDSVTIKGENVKIDVKNLNFNLINLEKSIVFDMCLRAKFHLDENPNAKLVLYFNYNDVIDTAAMLLDNYNPIILTGKTKVDDRFKRINLFNKGNSGYRVLIANTKVGGVGISLHDTEGGYPRIMYISPSYDIQSVYQATGRIVRQGGKSVPIVRIFYGHVLYSTDKKLFKEDIKDMVSKMFRVFEILAEKSDVTWKILDDNSISGLRMPSNYKYAIEGIEGDIV